MNREDFVNAYILLFSGAGKMKNAKEMWWKNENNNDITIEFYDLTFDKVMVRKYYSNGNKYYEWEYVKGKPHGKQIVWYENGNKCYEYEYVNGKLNGKYLGWWENGKQHCEEEWKNGVLLKYNM